MDKVLYDYCMGDANVDDLLQIIMRNIKLSKNSIPRCISMIRDTMKKNIGLLRRSPKTKEDLKGFAGELNKRCVDSIIETIAKKHPGAQINRRVQVTREQLRRDRDVMGDRPNHVSERPHIRSRRENDEDEDFHRMRPNDVGVAGVPGDMGAFAPAFGDHMLSTQIDRRMIQQLSNPGQQQHPQQQSNPSNPHSQFDTHGNGGGGGYPQQQQGSNNQLESRFNSMLNSRNSELAQRNKPLTPDFTDDGSGALVRQQKLARQMQMQGQGMSGGMGQGMPGLDGGLGMGNIGGMGSDGMFQGMPSQEDIYSSLLGAGAPQAGQQMPLMGMGNPLMPMSSTNMLSDQMGYGNMGSQGMGGMGMNGMNMQNYGTGGMGSTGELNTAKSQMLSNDYERKLAERNQIDIETNQKPVNVQGQPGSNPYGSVDQMGMGAGMMGGMGMGTQASPMGMNGMGSMMDPFESGNRLSVSSVLQSPGSFVSPDPMNGMMGGTQASPMGMNMGMPQFNPMMGAQMPMPGAQMQGSLQYNPMIGMGMPMMNQ